MRKHICPSKPCPLRQRTNPNCKELNPHTHEKEVYDLDNGEEVKMDKHEEVFTPGQIHPLSY